MRFGAWRFARAGQATRGQALVELAVFGGLLLMVLAVLIRSGLRLNYQQELAMRSFRDGLQDAGKLGKLRNAQVPSVTYTIIEDRQVPQPGDPFGLNARTRFMGSNNIVWGKHLFQTSILSERPSRMAYHVNYEANGEPRREAYTSEDFVNPLEDEQEGPNAPGHEHTLADHDAPSPYRMEVERDSEAHGVFTVRHGGSSGNSQTQARMMETVVTRWVFDGGGQIGEISNELQQETNR